MKTSETRIPFNVPYLTGKELNYVRDSIQSGQIVGGGKYAEKCQALLEQVSGAKKVLLTGSCTDALEMAALLIGLKPGDEVITPSFTFSSTANAFTLRGARPIFVDIREDTLNIDETKIEDHITRNTRAIFPMHYAGVGCEMDAIMDVAKRHRLAVVEDAAQAVNASYKGQPLGSIGDLGTYSFHATKNYTCGEGGAILINRADLVERAEILREKGTDRSKFLRGEIDKYTWTDTGSSFLLSDILAAFLWAQLEHLDDVLQKRRAIFQLYSDGLSELALAGKLRLPVIPDHCRTNYHLFHVLLPTEEARDALMARLRQANIQAVLHYVPLHTSPMGARFGYKEGDLPITENISRRLLRLPFYAGLRPETQQFVVASIKDSLR